MRPVGPSSKSARLRCEALEDRVNPVLAFSLSGVAPGAATLLAFDTNSPAITTSTTVTGIDPLDRLVGIDFRPQNGQLYGFGVALGVGTVYSISTRTGVATPVGGVGSVDPTNPQTGAAGTPLPDPTAAGVGFAFDFNPAVDKIRILASDGTANPGGTQSFVVDQNTGLAVVINGPVNGATNRGTGTSYTNTQPNAGATTQYTIDAASDALYLQIPATGVTTLIGAVKLPGAPLPLDFSAVNGFDIPTGVNVMTSTNPVTAGSAFAALTVGGVSRVYSVDLTTGVATNLGTIGTGAAVTGLAIQNDFGGFPAISVTSATPGTASLIRFNTSSPGTGSAPITVNGLNAGDTLVGISFRPQTGQLYGLGVTAAGAATLYLIDPQALTPGTATATVVGAVTGAPVLPNPATMGSGFGFAFNATVDLIRVLTSAGQSFAVNPNDGSFVGAAPSITLNGNPSSADAATYTNGFGQPTGVGGPTTLYTLDSVSDTLNLQNAGTSVVTRIAPVTLNGAPLNFSSVSGWDVAPGVRVATTNAQTAGVGFAALTVGTVTSLYQIDLTTGAATNLGALPTGTTGLTLADAPETIRFQSTTVTGNEGSTVNLVLTRTSANAPQTVTVTVSGGNATGADFTGGPSFTVTIPTGSTSATLAIPLTADMLTEGAEALTLAITNAPGAAFGAPVTLTINDTSITVVAAPFFSGATATAGGVVLTGSGVQGGTAFLPLPPGSSAFFADINGDGQNDVIFFLPGLVAALDGQTGRILALVTDLTGDGVADFQVFNADGTTTRLNGRTGLVF